MPDAQQENAFVEAFLLSECRERYKLFLANTRRRKKILDRLNHSLDYLPSLALPIPGGQHSAEGVARLLNKRGVKDTDKVYIFSDVRELDGVYLPMRQALEAVLLADSGSIVCCKAGRLAYYRPEAPATGCLLVKSEL
jgi:hypothetical protein